MHGKILYNSAKEPGLKLVLDAGFSCPGRCSFCDNTAFHPAYSTRSKSITQQLDEGIAFHAARGRTEGPYLAYFQSYSNTYAPLEHLKEVYGEALAHPAVSGIVIGTRPDCVDVEKLDYIASLGCARMEYGIESCRDETLLRVRRGHDFACSERAVRETAARGIPVCGHFILGLPGETRETLLEDVARINALPLDSVKFHQLQLLKGTPLAAEFAESRKNSSAGRWTSISTCSATSWSGCGPTSPSEGWPPASRPASSPPPAGASRLRPSPTFSSAASQTAILGRENYSDGSGHQSGRA
jgi:Predicted Fe-S oxidoreductase